MLDYDKDNQVGQAKFDVVHEFRKLHPTDKAEAYRAVEAWAGENAKQQEECNERDGVPERVRT